MSRPARQRAPKPSTRPAPAAPVVPRLHLTPRTWAVAALLVLLTVAAYFPVHQFGFVQLDDPAYVTENPQVQRGLTVEGVQWAFTTGHAANWHPLTWLSHMLDVSLFGMTPGAHHVVNVVIHTLSTVLLFLLLTGVTSALWRSAFVAAVFALHPLHVESVAWVAERKDVLAAFFWMTTLAAYAWYVVRPSRGRMAGVAVSLALGLMSKPMLVTLPCVLLLLDRWPLQRITHWQPATVWPLFKEKIPLFVLVATSSVVTLVVQQRGGAFSSLEGLPLSFRLGNGIISIARYIEKTFWPVDLSILYPLPDTIAPSLLLMALLLILGVTAVAIRAERRHPAFLVGWLWYLGTLVPVLGLVQVGVQAMADRYTYIPMIGLSIIVAWAPGPALLRSSPRRGAVAAVALGLVAAMFVTTRAQLPVWRDNPSLWTHATMVSTGVDAFTAHMSLAATLMQQQRYDEAVAHYTSASSLRPDDAGARRGMGLAYGLTGRISEAITALEGAASLTPNDVATLHDLAAGYERNRRYDDAIRVYRRLITLSPSNPRYPQALERLSRGPDRQEK